MMSPTRTARLYREERILTLRQIRDSTTLKRPLARRIVAGQPLAEAFPRASGRKPEMCSGQRGWVTCRATRRFSRIERAGCMLAAVVHEANLILRPTRKPSSCTGEMNARWRGPG